MLGAMVGLVTGPAQEGALAHLQNKRRHRVVHHGGDTPLLVQRRQMMKMEFAEVRRSLPAEPTAAAFDPSDQAMVGGDIAFLVLSDVTDVSCFHGL
jgi:hypothetical protein